MKDDLARRVAELCDDDEVRAALAKVCELTGMGFAAIAYVSDKRWIACQVDDQIEFGLDPGEELEIKKTICDDVRQCRAPIIIDDTGADPDWWSHPVPVLYGFQSYLSLPIILDNGEFFGTLCAIDPTPRIQPLKDCLADLEKLAREVALVISSKIESGRSEAASQTAVD